MFQYSSSGVKNKQLNDVYTISLEANYGWAGKTLSKQTEEGVSKGKPRGFNW